MFDRRMRDTIGTLPVRKGRKAVLLRIDVEILREGVEDK